MKSMGGTSAVYTYDADGRRVVKTVGSASTYYYYDISGKASIEKNQSNVWAVGYIYLNGQMVANFDGVAMFHRTFLSVGLLVASLALLYVLYPPPSEDSLRFARPSQVFWKYLSFGVTVTLVPILSASLVLWSHRGRPRIFRRLALIHGCATYAVLATAAAAVGTSTALLTKVPFSYPFLEEWAFVSFLVLTAPLLTTLGIAYLWLLLNRLPPQ